MGYSDERDKWFLPSGSYSASTVPVPVITGKSLNRFELKLLQTLIPWQYLEKKWYKRIPRANIRELVLQRDVYMQVFADY